MKAHDCCIEGKKRKNVGKGSHQSCPSVTGHTGTPASCPTLGIKPSPTIPRASVLSAIQLFLVRVPVVSDLKVQLRVAG